MRPNKTLHNKLFITLVLIEALTSACILFGTARELAQVDSNYPDFVAYVTAGYIAKNGEIKNLYDWETQMEYQKMVVGEKNLTGVLAFRNTPMFAYFFVPFTFLNYEYAYKLMLTINVIVIGLCAYLIKIFWQIETKLWVILTAALVLFIPVWATISSGQITTFVVLPVILGIHKILQSKYKKAGTLLGLTFLKPHFMIIIPLIAATLIKDKKAKEFIFGAGTVVFAFVILNTVILGPAFITKYPRYMFESEIMAYGNDVSRYFNLMPILINFANQTSAHIMLGIINGTIYFWILYTLTKKGFRTNAYNVIAILTPLINMHSMGTDTLIHLVPLYVLLNQYEKKLSAVYKIIIITGIFGVYYLYFLKLHYLVTILLIVFGLFVLKSKTPREIAKQT